LPGNARQKKTRHGKVCDLTVTHHTELTKFFLNMIWWLESRETRVDSWRSFNGSKKKKKTKVAILG
jgi:hypothetical protein